MRQCWKRWPEWSKRVAPETIDREAQATMQITIELPETIAEGLELRWSAIQASPCFLLDTVCSNEVPIHPPLDLLSFGWIRHLPPIH
jgi:hypothetical protein